MTTNRSFWRSAPGILTGIAAVLAAVAGLYTAMHATSGGETKSGSGVHPEKSTTSTSPVSPSPTVTTIRPSPPRPTLLAAPDPVSPADNALFTNYPRVTTLTWRPVTGASSYRVQIQCDTCGSTPWVDWKTDSTTDTSYTFTWVGDNTGRWRVSAVGSGRVSAGPSEWWHFSFRTPPAPPGPQGLTAPVPVSPADNELFTNYPRVTTLTWQPVTGAASYRVQIQCDTCGSTPWVDWRTDTTSRTSYTFTWVGDNTGRWRVSAVGSAGTTGPASDWMQFRFRT